MNWRDRAREKAIEQAQAAGGPVAACWIRGLTVGGDAAVASILMKHATGRVYHPVEDDWRSAHVAIVDHEPFRRAPGESLLAAKTRRASQAVAAAKARWVACKPHVDPGLPMSCQPGVYVNLPKES